MIKGVIFDLDGVLVFTDKFHYQAWKQIADEEKIPFDETINNRLRGVSRKESLEIILEKANKSYSETEKSVLCEKKNAIYRDYLQTMSPSDVTATVRDTLHLLKEKGIKIALGSASKNARFILDKTELTQYFDVISDGEGLVHSKPHPEVFLKACERLELKPSECLVVEDAEAGIEAANKGKFTSVGIGEAKKYKHTQISIECLSELSEILKSMSGIVISGLSKEYTPGVKAVNDVNIVIEDKEFVVLVGPSGCGKSTILRMIAGLEEITDGQIYIGGKLINDVEPKDRNIAMVFQNYALYPQLTVGENIGFYLKVNKILREKPFVRPTSKKKLRNFWYKIQYPFVKSLKYRHMRKEEIDERVKEVADTIGLTPYLQRKPGQLSGGQRQRVALGRSIVRNPEVFLFDEPLSNLDAKMRASMRTEITKLHNRLKTTFIYVTHDQIEAMTMGTKIVILKDGVVQQYGNPSYVFDHPVNKFVAGFIGTPQMNFMDAKLQVLGKNVLVEFGKHRLNLALALDSKVACYNEKEVTLGIRPRSIALPSSQKFKADSVIEGTINVVEQLGDEVILYLTVEGKEEDFVIYGDAKTQYQIGQTIIFSVNDTEIHLFDKQTEICIK